MSLRKHKIRVILLLLSAFSLSGFRYAQTLSAAQAANAAQAAQEPKLSEEEMRKFLLTAPVIKDKSASKGVTGVRRLSLDDGKITHDAAFQSINESTPKMEFAGGKIEMNFRDSYKYDIAAYELAKLLGLGDMMPVTVSRKYQGKTGALSWWLPVKMDEAQRLRKKIEPPNREAWNEQMHKMRVFTQLVYDTDRNLGNVLISEDWHLWMIDFSRAFRVYHYLENSKNLEKCDRRLLESLRRLDGTEFKARTKDLLTKPEVDGVMARRDVIVKYFEKLIKEKGEAEVLY